MSYLQIMNSRALSVLKIVGLVSRIVYDELEELEIPNHLDIDFEPVNMILSNWKQKSFSFLETALRQQ